MLDGDANGNVGAVAGLDAGTDVGRPSLHQQQGLVLHVGSHEGPVGVVIFEE